MKDIFFVTAITENYVEKAIPFFDSLKKYFTKKYHVFCVDFEIKNELRKKYEDIIEFLKIDSFGFKAINCNFCLQDGSFLSHEIFKDFDSEDIIVFTDSDMILQREITNDEFALFENIKELDFTFNYNKTKEDMLVEEGLRLWPKQNKEYLIQSFPDYEKYNLFGTAFMGMQFKTYKHIYNLYVYYYPKIVLIFGHYARQQWLISYIYNELGLNPILVPYEFHSHGCYPLTKDHKIDKLNKVLKYKNNMVAFRHNVNI